MIVTADIGGTKVDIAAFPAQKQGEQVPEPQHFRRCFTKEYEDFEHLLSSFLKETNVNPTAISIGIAGPVWGDEVKLTNLDWTLNRLDLMDRFDCQAVAFLNDMEAHAHGALVLDESGYKTLNEGTPREGNRALIAAGTGLGEAFMVWDENQYKPFACEGGHTSFAPQSELESDLLKFAQKRHHHVSAERLISGSLGFPILRDFFEESGRLEGTDPTTRKKLLEADSVGPLISQLADNGEKACVEMMRVFVAIYGAESSNLVLKVNGIGGLYIGGGIAKKIYSWLEKGTFISAFGNKGRFRQLMEDTPIWVITDPHNALRGLASYGYSCL